MSNFESVKKFMKTFGQEVKEKAEFPNDKITSLRFELIQEELGELKDALDKKDIKEVADALTDILYVTYGAGHAFGINLDKCFEEVQNSNMSKLGKDGKPIYNERGKVMISSRDQVTEHIVSSKVRLGIQWSDVANEVGLSKEWVTAACLGQMAMEKAHAEIVGRIFELSDEEVAWLQIVPYKGSIPTAVPTDPLIYRWYEVVNVYGTTIKELIHEEFGDGIMSAIDFSMDIQREPDPVPLGDGGAKRPLH